MLVMVCAISLLLIAVLMVEPLRQLLYRRRNRRWTSYYRN